jgi:hypothetical protein
VLPLQPSQDSKQLPSPTSVRPASRAVSELRHAISLKLVEHEGGVENGFGKMDPLLLNGGTVVKTLSVAFLADFETAWRKHGVLDWIRVTNGVADDEEESV